MKRTLLSLATVLLLLFAAGPAQASPLLYTFQGVVTSNAIWNCGQAQLAWAAEHGIPYPGPPCAFASLPGANNAPGTPVALSALIDFSVDPFPDTPGHDYFYAEYVSGPSVWYNMWNFSASFGENGVGLGWLFGNQGREDQTFVVWRSAPVSSWIVGDHVTASEWFGPEGGYISHNLELTRISTPVPVPEPASVLLLSTGLVGLVGTARRRLRK